MQSLSIFSTSIAPGTTCLAALNVRKSQKPINSRQSPLRHEARRCGDLVRNLLRKPRDSGQPQAIRSGSLPDCDDEIWVRHDLLSRLFTVLELRADVSKHMRQRHGHSVQLDLRTCSEQVCKDSARSLENNAATYLCLVHEFFGLAEHHHRGAKLCYRFI
eukprot:scaffold1638_cov258-Pinguiococcus_pyrenoidosus.AAC.14